MLLWDRKLKKIDILRTMSRNEIEQNKYLFGVEYLKSTFEGLK
jgi:hypothetical protein